MGDGQLTEVLRNGASVSSMDSPGVKMLLGFDELRIQNLQHQGFLLEIT